MSIITVMLLKYSINDKSDELDDKCNSGNNAYIIMTVWINSIVRIVLQQKDFWSVLVWRKRCFN